MQELSLSELLSQQEESLPAGFSHWFSLATFPQPKKLKSLQCTERK